NDTVSQSFSTSFIRSGGILPPSVKGDVASAPFTSLQPALEGVTLSTSVTCPYRVAVKHSVLTKPQD
ncbi:hypothetical protein PISMIDRAFT_91829, partial [Pisolithus microcarpus 441]